MHEGAARERDTGSGFVGCIWPEAVLPLSLTGLVLTGALALFRHWND
jgi:hypothetical protein